MKLNTKLIIIMLSLLVLAMLTLFTLNQYAQNDLVREIQESSQEISKASLKIGRIPCFSHTFLCTGLRPFRSAICHY